MRLGQGRRRGALEVVGGDVDGWLELDSVRRFLGEFEKCFLPIAHIFTYL